MAVRAFGLFAVVLCAVTLCAAGPVAGVAGQVERIEYCREVEASGDYAAVHVSLTLQNTTKGPMAFIDAAIFEPAIDLEVTDATGRKHRGTIRANPYFNELDVAEVRPQDIRVIQPGNTLTYQTVLLLTLTRDVPTPRGRLPDGHAMAIVHVLPMSWTIDLRGPLLKLLPSGATFVAPDTLVQIPVRFELRRPEPVDVCRPSDVEVAK